MNTLVPYSKWLILLGFRNQGSDDSEADSDEEDSEEEETPKKVCLTFSDV